MATNTTYNELYYVFLGFSYFAAVVMFIFGVTYKCTGYQPENMVRKVFPYIKKSGSHFVVFGSIIPKKYIRYHFLYMTAVVQSIIFVVLYNTFLTTSNTYSPHNGLDCIAFYTNGSKHEVTSEEQAESENVTRIRCYGWKFDIAGGIGHAAAILTLSWLFVSIVLWVKLKWYHAAINCMNNGRSNGKRRVGICCFLTVILLQLFIFIGSIIAFPVAAFSLNKILSPDQFFDIGLVGIILTSGLVIFPDQNKSKSLAEYCKEVVENNKGRQEEDLEEIKERLTERVQGHRIQVDLLVELAELECKKALADIYYYDIDSKEKRGDGENTITEEEMKTIAKVAYRKIAPDDEEETNDQESNTTGEDEHAGLLMNIRNPTSYSQLN